MDYDDSEFDVAPRDEVGGIFSGEVLPPDPHAGGVPAAPDLPPVPVPMLMSEPPGPAAPESRFVPYASLPGAGYGEVPAPAVQAVPREGAHLLGLSLVALAAGSYAGYRYGGMFGSMAGVLAGGAAVNALRAFLYLRGGSPDGRREALVSGSYALAGAVAAGVLWYKTVHTASSEGSSRSAGPLAQFDAPGVRKAT